MSLFCNVHYVRRNNRDKKISLGPHETRLLFGLEAPPLAIRPYAALTAMMRLVVPSKTPAAETAPLESSAPSPVPSSRDGCPRCRPSDPPGASPRRTRGSCDRGPVPK